MNAADYGLRYEIIHGEYPPVLCHKKVGRGTKIFAGLGVYVIDKPLDTHNDVTHGYGGITCYRFSGHWEVYPSAPSSKRQEPPSAEFIFYGNEANRFKMYVFDSILVDNSLSVEPVDISLSLVQEGHPFISESIHIK